MPDTPVKWVNGAIEPLTEEEIAQREADAAWTAAGGPVPATITNFQMRAVLLGKPGPGGVGTMFSAINDALDAAKAATTEGARAWQAWEYANEVTREGELVGAIAASFGIDAPTLNAWFREAAAVQA